MALSDFAGKVEHHAVLILRARVAQGYEKLCYRVLGEPSHAVRDTVRVALNQCGDDPCPFLRAQPFHTDQGA
jgi:hypothetical protein